jgi:hypothetical protein
MSQTVLKFGAILALACLSACGGAGSSASGDSLCLQQARFVFGGTSTTTSSGSTCSNDTGSTNADGDSISELPAIPAPQPNLFIGSSVLDVADIDDFKTTATAPGAVNIKLTSTNNFSALENRSLITSMLSKADTIGTTPVITLATLFNKSYTTQLSLNYRLTSTINIEYFFTQLHTLLDLTNSARQNVVILLEPHLMDSVIASYGLNASPSAISVPTHIIYDLGYLDTSKDPSFADNLAGFVAATNYLVLTTRTQQQYVAWQLTINSAAATSNLIDAFRDQSGAALATNIHNTAKEYATLMTAMGFETYGLHLAGFALNGDASWRCDTAASIATCTDALTVSDWDNLTDFLAELHNESDFYFLLTNVSFSHLATNLVQKTPYDLAGNYIFGGDFSYSDAYFDGYAAGTTEQSNHIRTVTSHLEDLYNSFVVGIIFGDFDARDTDYATDGGWWLNQLAGFDATQYPIN